MEAAKRHLWNVNCEGHTSYFRHTPHPSRICSGDWGLSGRLHTAEGRQEAHTPPWTKTVCVRWDPTLVLTLFFEAPEGDTWLQQVWLATGTDDMGQWLYGVTHGGHAHSRHPAGQSQDQSANHQTCNSIAHRTELGNHGDFQLQLHYREHSGTPTFSEISQPALRHWRHVGMGQKSHALGHRAFSESVL